MWPPGLGVAPHQHRVLRIQKDHARVQQHFHLFENLRETVKGLALPDIDYDHRALNFVGFFHQSGKIGHSSKGRLSTP